VAVVVVLVKFSFTNTRVFRWCVLLGCILRGMRVFVFVMMLVGNLYG